MLLVAACSVSDPASDVSTSTTADEISVSSTFDLQGHRGARGLRPENTLPAFEAAMDIGVTTLELDLHFTSDGQVVVWHDPEVVPGKCGLASGVPEGIPDPDDITVASADLMIRALTVDQLRWYQCDRNPDSDRFPDQSAASAGLSGDGYGIVTLGELFEFVETYGASDAKSEAQRATAAAIRFNIETKRRPDEPETIGDGFDGANAGPFELEILRIIGIHDLEDRVVIQSFDHRSLWAVHAVDPSIILAALSTRAIDVEDIASQGASIWSPSQTVVTSQRIQDAHDAGLLVIPWTVNDPADMNRLIDLGVDGLITDRPDILIPMVSRG
jgi:glycerophosphoryl diester phosphodiesterase